MILLCRVGANGQAVSKFKPLYGVRVFVACISVSLYACLIMSRKCVSTDACGAHILVCRAS